jgi:hypothetical protein
VLAVARFVFRRDAALRFASVMAAIAYLGSLGPTLRVTRSSTGIPLPEWVLRHLPVLDSIAPSHFGIFVDFFAGMALAVVLDRVHGRGLGALAGPVGHPAVPPVGGRRLPLGVVCAAIASVCLVPMLLLPPWPYPVRHVAEPPIFRQPTLTALPQTAIVAEYPPVLASDGAPLLWQAMGGITYELSDGYGLVPGAGAHATVQPPVDALSLVFAASALGTLKVPLTASADLALRRALVHDHVRALVVTPGAEGSSVIAYVLTLLLGRPTLRLQGAAMWIFPSTEAGPP